MNQRATTGPEMKPDACLAHPPGPVMPARGGRQVRGRADQAKRRDATGCAARQPHADHPAERDTAVTGSLDAQGIQQREDAGAQVAAIEYGPGHAAAPPCPGSSKRRHSRKSRRRSGNCRSHTAVLVPSELPSTSTGASCGPSNSAATGTGHGVLSDIEEAVDIEEHSLVIALQADIEPEIDFSALLRRGDQRPPPHRRYRGEHRVLPRSRLPRRAGRSWSLPGRAGRGQRRTRLGAEPQPAAGGRERAGPQRDDPVLSLSVGRAPAEPAERRHGWRGRAARVVGVIEPNSGSACQVSTSASAERLAGSSSTLPAITIAPGVSGGTTNGPSGHGSPMARKGPTVCDGVTPAGTAPYPSDSKRRSRSAPAARCPAIPKRPVRLGQADIEGRDETLPRLLIGYRVEDRVQREQRVGREVHLGDQPLGERAAEQREVDVRRPPGVVVIAPRVGPRLDRDEPVPAERVRHAARLAVKFGSSGAGWSSTLCAYRPEALACRSR